MSPRLSALLLALVPAAIAFADSPRAWNANSSDDVQDLQGFWVLKRIEYGGVWANEDPAEDELRPLGKRISRIVEEREDNSDLEEGRTTLEFRRDTYVYRLPTYRFSGESIRPTITKGKFTMEPGRRPKVMSRLPDDELGSGEGPVPERFIYRVSGNVLQIAFDLQGGTSRLPTTFVTREDNEVVLLTFRRERRSPGYVLR